MYRFQDPDLPVEERIDNIISLLALTTPIFPQAIGMAESWDLHPAKSGWNKP